MPERYGSAMHDGPLLWLTLAILAAMALAAILG
jgi:hypothetical protein